MKPSRAFMRVYIIPIVLLSGILLSAGFTLFYTATARTRTGQMVRSNWPREFTLAFSREITVTNGVPAVTDAGKTLLRDNGLWLQVLDASGAEIVQYGKPAGTPGRYQPYELLMVYQYGDGTSSVFIGSLPPEKGGYPYLIGFPLHISKVTMYVDNARFYSGRALILAVAALTAVLVVTLTVYSYRTFLSAENRRVQDERAKEEWLSNITHDLKTPLAPIRGYGELLSEKDGRFGEDVRRYGAVLLKNVLYAEQLVDDLKLTYQLQSNLLPLKAENRNLTRFVREIIIDILNMPEYEGRSIAFFAGWEDRYARFDGQLFRRALINILVNALKHNKPDTKIAVAMDWHNGVKITVADNGSGMTQAELQGLFQRYYRGTGTEVKAEGSGLGMAIAKQIVEAHGGRISAQSETGKGTTVTMEFPESFKVEIRFPAS